MRPRIAYPHIVSFVLLALLTGCAASRPALPLASPAALRSTVEYLASDDLQGRGVGTPGLERAGDYISGYFDNLGLRPAPGTDSYFQSFDYRVLSGPSSDSNLRALGKIYRGGIDIQPDAMSAERGFSGPLVFVGYGIDTATANAADLASAATTKPISPYDDYANIDVKGKVALAILFEPHDAQGTSRLSGQKDVFSSFAPLTRKARLAADRGAAALLVVAPPNFHQEPPLRTFGGRDGGAAAIPVIHITPDTADDLLEAGGKPSLKQLQASIDQNFKPNSFDVPMVPIRGKAELDYQTMRLRNVTAMLPGAGPHSDEFIVIGAHYDHLGMGGPGSLVPGVKAIHHGADDNASGTAAVMELARIFSGSASHRPLERSLLFVTFSGEERGLLGSKYWVEHPPVPLSRIPAMVNLDMVGRLSNDVLQVDGTGTAAPFKELVNDAQGAQFFVIQGKWNDGQSPSDIMSFVLRGVPGLSFWTGYHADYHRPTDTADKINYAGEARIVNFTAGIVQQLSRLPRGELAYTPPPPSTRPATSQPAPRGASVRFGVIPDYQADGGDGVRIDGTSPNSPAEKAGLQPGDVIRRFGEFNVANLYDLMDALGGSVPNAPVKVRILRNGQFYDFTAIPEPARTTPP